MISLSSDQTAEIVLPMYLKLLELLEPFIDTSRGEHGGLSRFHSNPVDAVCVSVLSFPEKVYLLDSDTNSSSASLV